MHRSTHHWQGVANDRTRECGTVATELLVTVRGQALATSDLEHCLGKRRPEMRARINAREKLQRSDLSPCSSAQLQALRP
jgi:hypothetical protein